MERLRISKALLVVALLFLCGSIYWIIVLADKTSNLEHRIFIMSLLEQAKQEGMSELDFVERLKSWTARTVPVTETEGGFELVLRDKKFDPLRTTAVFYQVYVERGKIVRYEVREFVGK